MGGPQFVNQLTMIFLIVVVVMFILLGILVVIYFASRNKKETEKINKGTDIEKKKKTATKGSGDYSRESIFKFMEFDNVEDNMIIQKDGKKFIMVVECQGVNYDLMSEDEKIGVEEGFIQFLNTLRHPIQIYVQTRTIDLGSSIESYRNQVRLIENDLEKRRERYDAMLASRRYSEEQLNKEYFELTKDINLYEYGKDIIYTTEKMSLNKNVLNKKYYVIIPYVPEDLAGSSFDKEEIKNLAFSELYTRAQSVNRTLASCGVNGKVLNSNELVELLYIAYNRDEAEVFGLNKALKAGYDELYSTAPDVLDKKIEALNRKIDQQAYELANQKAIEAKSDKQLEIERKENNLDDIVSDMAKLILEQSKAYIGDDISKRAKEKIDNDTKERKSKEGGKEDVGEKETKTRKRATRRA